MNSRFTLPLRKPRAALLVPERESEAFTAEVAVPSPCSTRGNKGKGPGASVIAVEDAFPLSTVDVNKISLAAGSLGRYQMQIASPIQMASRRAAKDFCGLNQTTDWKRDAAAGTRNDNQ
jgi:hypothetical protein